MRTKILAIVIALTSTVAFAQEKANLTKDETIKYLNEKLFISSEGTVGKYSSTLQTNRITLFTDNIISFIQEAKSDGGYQKKIEIRFRPAKIKEIQLEGASNYPGISVVIITFADKTASKRIITWYENYKDVTPIVGKDVFNLEYDDSIKLFFYNQDTNNFNRLKKALLYLTALCKAEGDPFD